MAFDILGYRDYYKDYYGDTPIEDVAKDAYNRGFHKGEPDFQTWSVQNDIDPVIKEERKKRQQAEIDDRLTTAAQQALAPAQPKPVAEETTALGELGRGAATGALLTAQSIGQVLEYTGKLTGIKPIEDIGATTNEYWTKTMEPLQGSIKDVRDINSWSDFGKWASWNVGQAGGLIATIIPFMFMGGGEAAIGGNLAKGGWTVLGGLLKRSPGATTQFAKFMAQWAKPSAVDIPIGLVEAGQVFGGQLESLKRGEIDELHPIRGLVAAAIATKLEELGDVMAVQRMVKQIGGKSGNLIADIVKGAVGTGLGEASEEFFQTYAEQFGIDPKDITSKEQFMQALNGAAAGFVGGAAIGAGMEPLNRGRKEGEEKPPGGTPPGAPPNNEQARQGYMNIVEMRMKSGLGLEDNSLVVKDTTDVIRNAYKREIFSDEDLEKIKENNPVLTDDINAIIAEKAAAIIDAEVKAEQNNMTPTELRQSVVKRIEELNSKEPDTITPEEKLEIKFLQDNIKADNMPELAKGYGISLTEEPEAAAPGTIIKPGEMTLDEFMGNLQSSFEPVGTIPGEPSEWIGEDVEKSPAALFTTEDGKYYVQRDDGTSVYNPETKSEFFDNREAAWEEYHKQESTPEEAAKPGEEKPAVVTAKEPWQMTKEEYDKDVEEYDKTTKAEDIKKTSLSADTIKKALDDFDLTNTHDLIETDNKEISFGLSQGAKKGTYNVVSNIKDRSGFYKTQPSISNATPQQVEQFVNDNIKNHYSKGVYEKYGENAHVDYVKQAIAEGKSVPAAVLAEYPELAKEKAKVPAAPVTPEAPATPQPNPVRDRVTAMKGTIDEKLAFLNRYESSYKLTDENKKRVVEVRAELEAARGAESARLKTEKEVQVKAAEEARKKREENTGKGERGERKIQPPPAKVAPEEKKPEEPPVKLQEPVTKEDKEDILDDIASATDEEIDNILEGATAEEPTEKPKAPPREQKEAPANVEPVSLLKLSEAIKAAKSELYPDKDYQTLNTTEHDNVTVRAHEMMRKSPAAPTAAAPEAAPAAKNLNDILSAVTQEGVTGAEEAIKGLYELFGGGALKTFPGGFDEDTYAKAKPHFEAALNHFIEVGKGLKEFAATIVKQFGDAIKPYLKRFITDKRNEMAGEVEKPEEVVNLDENTGKGEKGERKRRKLTAQEKAEREAKKKAAAEKKARKAELSDFENVGYVYDPEKLKSVTRDKTPKSAAEAIIDQLTPKAIWGAPYATEATPGTVRLNGQLQKYFYTFKDYLFSSNKRLRYSRGKNTAERVDYWLNKLDGTIEKLQEYAVEYGQAIQPFVDTFKGATNVTGTIGKLQDLFIPNEKLEDGTYPHSYYNTKLYQDSARTIPPVIHYESELYAFITRKWQELLAEENEILLDEIDYNKRPRNKEVVRNGLPEYLENVELKKTEDFSAPFDFNGVGFGELGWINQEERNRVIKAAYNAFKDLAATVNAPDAGMGLGGRLAVQFANLGHKAKGAAACYFTKYQTINFTRDNGDGTMAHEWSHALSDLASGEAHNEILSIIKNFQIIYDFDAGKRFADDLLAIDSPFLKRLVSSKKQPRIDAVKEQIKERYEGVVRKDTDYYNTAKQMRNKDYQTEGDEMWARAFEAYIFDTLKGTNNFLVNDFVENGRVGGRRGGTKHLIYPAGVERETFNGYIKHFLEGLNWEINENTQTATRLGEAEQKPGYVVPKLKDDYVTIEENNAELLRQKLEELLAEVEARYEAIWASEKSDDGYYWYKYNETSFGVLMQPDGYVGYDKGFQSVGQNGTGAVCYLTQLHPDSILDFKLSNFKYGDNNATYIKAGGVQNGDINGDTAQLLEKEESQADEGVGEGRPPTSGDTGENDTFDEDGTRQPPKPRGELGSGDVGTETAPNDDTSSGASSENYQIDDDTLNDPKPVATRFTDNLSAIKLLNLITSENRNATLEEKNTLAKISGWGGLSEVFSYFPEKEWKGRAELLNSELTADEKTEAARAGVTAYYTPVPVAKFMWDLAVRLGFKGGLVLEPAVGANGTFFGTMPQNLQAAVSLQGVEMDVLSVRFAKMLYPNSSIDNSPFQSITRPRNRFALTITNVPFSNDIKPFDKLHNKNKYGLHNYYINKMLDLTAPGSLSIMITSSDTLDSGGKHLIEYSQKADLVGAIRLPSKIYTQTDVTTDILVFRKKIDGSSYQGTPAADWTTVEKDESTGLTINKYFIAHPDMVAGKMESVTGRFGSEALRVIGDGQLNRKLQDMAAAFPSNIVESVVQEKELTVDDMVAAPGSIKEGGLYINEKDQVCMKELGLEKVLPNKTVKEKNIVAVSRGFIHLLDQVRTLIRAQINNEDATVVNEGRAKLKRYYDAFVKKFGIIHKKENMAIISDIIDSPWVITLEEYDPVRKEVTRLADIFTEDIAGMGAKKPIYAESDEDALAIALDVFGYPNLDFMAQLRKSDTAAVSEGLKDKLIENPETGTIELTEQYLSGNVRRKLNIAREMSADNPEYNRNVTLLEAALPQPMTPERITARIGASWLLPKHIEDFIIEKLSMNVNRLTPVVNFSPTTGSWLLSYAGQQKRWSNRGLTTNETAAKNELDRLKKSVAATVEWGTTKKDFTELMQCALNNKPPFVKVKGKLDEEATREATVKIEQIQREFQRWLLNDDTNRAVEAVDRFNEMCNTSVPLKADGSHLTFPGKSLNMVTAKEKETLGLGNDVKTFYPHQVNAVWKYLTNGNIYLAHDMGTGKTVTMTLLAMEAKRLRGKKKILYVTLNDNTYGQAIAEIKRIYPLANILPVRISDVENRKKRAIHKMAMNNFDIAIMRQTDFNRLGLSPQQSAIFMQEEIDEAREQLEEAKAAGAHLLQRDIEKKLMKLAEKLKKTNALYGEAKDAQQAYFDDIGCDLLIVDEAHSYKNIPYLTKMSTMSGLNPDGNDTAEAFFWKIRYLNKQFPKNDAVVLASGTPLSNSIAELYNIQRMLQPAEVNRQRTWSFDRWAQNYCEIGTTWRWHGAKQEFQPVKSIEKIVNAGRLLATVFQNVDSVQDKDIPYIKRPDVKTGAPQVLEVQPNKYVLEYNKIALKRMAEIERDPKHAMYKGVPDNILRIVSNMALMAIDQRLLVYKDENHNIIEAPYQDTELQKDSKIYQVTELAYRRWQEEKEHKGVQLLFADVGKPPKAVGKFKYISEAELNEKSAEEQEEYAQDLLEYENSSPTFSLYTEVKNILIKKGIPSSEIAFIHDADHPDPDEKQARLLALFDKVNRGEVRVLIGSTKKSGTGVNVQERVSDIIHIDAWWNISDWLQRNKRGVRPGNIYTDLGGINIWNVITRHTVDAHRWDIIAAKGKILNAVLSGDVNADVFEDTSVDTISSKYAAAIASGNENMMKLATLIQQIADLRNEMAAFLAVRARAKRSLAMIPDEIDAAKNQIDSNNKSIDLMKQVTAVQFHGDERTYVLEKHGKEIAEKLKEAVPKNSKEMKEFSAVSWKPLLVFGAHTEEEAIELVEGKDGKQVEKKVKKYIFTPLPIKADIHMSQKAMATDMWIRGSIKSADRELSWIDDKVKDKPVVNVTANISRTVTEYISRFTSMNKTYEDTIDKLSKDVAKYENIIGKEWDKASELDEKKKELEKVEALVSTSEKGTYTNPKTGIPIEKLAHTIPVIEDVEPNNAASWGTFNNQGEEFIVSRWSSAPAQIGIRSYIDLAPFLGKGNKFKHTRYNEYNVDGSTRMAMVAKPTREISKPFAYTIIDDETLLWLRHDSGYLTVEPNTWFLFERILGKDITLRYGDFTQYQHKVYRDDEQTSIFYVIAYDKSGQSVGFIKANEPKSIPSDVENIAKEVPTETQEVENITPKAEEKRTTTRKKGTTQTPEAPVTPAAPAAPLDQELTDEYVERLLKHRDDVQSDSYDGDQYTTDELMNKMSDLIITEAVLTQKGKDVVGWDEVDESIARAKEYWQEDKGDAELPDNIKYAISRANGIRLGQGRLFEGNYSVRNEGERYATEEIGQTAIGKNKNEKGRVVSEVRQGHQQAVEAQRQFISESDDAPAKIRDACRQGKGLVFAPEYYDNADFIEARDRGAKFGLDIIPVIDTSRSINARVDLETGAMFLNMDMETADLSPQEIVDHEISHYKGNSETQLLVDIKSEAFRAYRMWLSNAFGRTVDVELARAEIAADLEALVATRRNGTIKLADALLPNAKVKTIREIEATPLATGILNSTRTRAAPVFYSHLINTVEKNVKTMPAVAQSLVKWLSTQQVKPAEMEWMDVEGWLNDNTGKDGKFDRDKFLEFLKSNQIQIKEIEKTKDNYPHRKKLDNIKRKLQSMGYRFTDYNGTVYISDMDYNKISDSDLKKSNPAAFKLAQEAANIVYAEFADDTELYEAPGKTKYHADNYNLLGGENYTELLFTVPLSDKKVVYTKENVKPISPSEWEATRPELFWYFRAPDNVYQILKSDYPTQAEALEYVLNYKKPIPEPDYQSAHWKEANVLAHVRMDDRTDLNDGRYTLLIEEVQSDWLQDAKKYGIASGKYIATPLHRLHQELRTARNAITGHVELEVGVGTTLTFTAEEMARKDELDRKIQEIVNNPEYDREVRTKPPVSRAPFAENWHEFLMKRMLRYAAENGYDKLAWTTGKQQIQRYELRKFINRLSWVYHAESGIFDIEVRDKNDRDIAGIPQSMTGSELEEYFGKAMANKILSSPQVERAKNPDNRLRTAHDSYTGIDLEVGGEGMEKFYDELIPGFMRKYVKKWGSKVYKTAVNDFVNRPYYELWYGREGEPPTHTVFWNEEEASREASKMAALASLLGERPLKTEIKKVMAAKNAKDKYGEVHVVDITPEMKNSVMEDGQAFFSVRAPKNPPKTLDPNKIRQYLRDETQAIAEVIHNKLRPTKMTWLETMLKSPEWFGHPVLQNIVRIFVRDRNEMYHETFNYLNATDDITAVEKTVTDAGKALRVKGLSFAQRLMGKVSDEYQKLTDFIDYFDTEYKRDDSKSLEENMTDCVDYMKRNGASDEVIRVWRLYRDSYDKALDLMTKQMRTMIDQITEEANLIGEKPDYGKLKQTLKGALAQMEEWRGFYAPRQRDPGNWKVLAYKAHGVTSESKEWTRIHRKSELAARRAAKKLQREGWTIQSIGEIESLPEGVQQDLRSAETAALIEGALEKYVKKTKIGSANAVSFNEEVLRAVANEIKSRGFRATMMHRRQGQVIKGYITDPIERHVLYINSVAGGLSKATASRLAVKELTGTFIMGQRFGGIDPYTEGKAYTVGTDYIEEQLRNTEAVDRMIGLAKSIATFKFLGFNIRSVAVNLTAIATTAPAAIHQYAMGGKGSISMIIKELAKAGKDYGAVMAGKANLSPEEQRFVDEEHRLGWDDAQYTRDALGKMARAHSRAWSMLMDAAMYVFGKTEKWNRGTTMLAAYRIARKNGASVEEAADMAKTSSDKAHGIYGKATYPMWAAGSNPAAKIGQMMYVYAKFGHNYLQMLYDMGVNKRNIKGSLWAFLSPIVVAGGAALPFKGAIFAVVGFILSLFGFDRDPEKWVWDTIREHLGETGETIGRHGLTGAAGLDISGSLSIGIGVPKSFVDLTGAIGGVATELYEAKESASKGQYGQVAEHLLPTGLANPIRAIREAKYGAKTKNERPVWDEKGRIFKPNAAQAAARAFGFRSTKQAVLSERTWEGHRQQTESDKKRNEIYEKYRAWSLGERDRDLYYEIRDDVMKYNQWLKDNEIKAPRITRESLARQTSSLAKPSKRERSILAE
jgi:N12 class adenine-specific DNA methylase